MIRRTHDQSGAHPDIVGSVRLSLAARLWDALIGDSVRRTRAMIEIRSLRRAGARVPNRLWRDPRRSDDALPAQRVIRVIESCALLAAALHLMVAHHARFAAVPPPLGPILMDFSLLIGIVLTTMCLLALIVRVYQPRWLQLRNIRSARRRLAPWSAHAQKRRDADPHATIRHLALLAGIAVYAVFLAPAASPGGNWPHTLIVLSAVVGHARVLPIVLFPLLTEITARRIRRRRLTQRLMYAERS